MLPLTIWPVIWVIERTLFIIRPNIIRCRQCQLRLFRDRPDLLAKPAVNIIPVAALMPDY